jgi:hypothetical protein
MCLSPFFHSYCHHGALQRPSLPMYPSSDRKTSHKQNPERSWKVRWALLSILGSRTDRALQNFLQLPDATVSLFLWVDHHYTIAHVGVNERHLTGALRY